jgi:ketosteroid isomerase-like protein
MAREHIDIVRAACAAWNSGDISVYWDLYAPDVIADGGSLWPEAGGPVNGPEALMHNYESIRATFDYSELHPEGFVEGDNVLVVAMRWRGVPRGGERIAEQRLFVSYRFRDGRIWRQWWSADVDEALDAVGLPRGVAASLTAQIAAPKR